MGTGVLAIALCPQLVALVARPADSPPNGTSRTRRPRRAIAVLPVLRLGPRPGHVRVHTDVLLELLEGVVGALRHALEAAGVEMRVGGMAVGEESGGGDGMVWREPVERVGQHVVWRVDRRLGVLRQLDGQIVSRGERLDGTKAEERIDHESNSSGADGADFERVQEVWWSEK